MQKKLDSYKGPLSNSQTANGMNAALRNAVRLAKDARLLLDADRLNADEVRDDREVSVTPDPRWLAALQSLSRPKTSLALEKSAVNRRQDCVVFAEGANSSGGAGEVARKLVLQVFQV
ncbi:hypothetical protein [Pseudomonas sp. FP1742]|uniref:hypothetical protein n=1 Tax=Pseudomonas sp. FP1742 TaxID=2954079 RepID=UPI002733A612|nr:hypothetical protein [Pseudomonas sp. FP1742]WLG51111.1 hypothetical protein PSH64_00940 [Pseudomonas sp. FP1742]